MEVLNRTHHDDQAERLKVVTGLLAPEASLPPKYFYDELGCALYGAICQLPEYYPTRTELAIFQSRRAEIADAMGAGRQFVDLGAGDCCKAESWLPFLSPSRYVAVDIAGAEIERALARMSLDFPEVDMIGVVTDFSESLDLADVIHAGPVTFFYPGSSIGNFTPEDALGFLKRIFAMCSEREQSGLLIGVDAKKSNARLQAAYDDALGVTAAFNRNVLLHLNRRFGFDFDLNGYRHLGLYNAVLGRIEMHLESLRDQTVRLAEGAVRIFAKGERIHTENSYKYTAEEFEALLAVAGFSRIQRWTDADEQFNVFFAC
ncbi:MAG: L-histidine N(alpha)-methyltransferase [Betaproteobacteria bacterium]|nr:L-histidine N(alpha)-methyltransferase [Betaproteobacteria bacterium]